MNIGTFIFKNAFRNKRRAMLCILSVAVSLFLFITLLVALREITVPPEDIGAATRVVVRSKISIANMLPARQRAIIEKLPGVESVTPLSFFGGKFRNEDFPTFAQFAVDPVNFQKVFGEATMPEEQRQAFLADRTACVVGRDTVEKYKLKIGDRLTLIGTLYPCDLELKLAGIYEGTIDDRNLFFHHKYLDEAAGTEGSAGTWFLKAKSIGEVDALIGTINKKFENTNAEVRAETERAFQMSFVSMWGNIKVLVGAICSVVIFTLVLVTASTMSMAIRERFRELAVLKALGFRRKELFAFILAESFGISMVGAVVGVFGAYLAYMKFLNISKLTNGIFIQFEVTTAFMAYGFLIAAGLGIIASIAPSIAVARMSVVAGLKTLD